MRLGGIKIRPSAFIFPGLVFVFIVILAFGVSAGISPERDSFADAFSRALPETVVVFGVLAGALAAFLAFLIVSVGASGRLFGAFLLPAIPALALAFLSVVDTFGIARRAAEQTAVQSIRLIAVNNESIIQNGKNFLEGFTALPELRTEDWRGCSERAAIWLRAKENYTNIGVVDAAGNLVCSALPFEESVSMSDRPAIRKTLATKKFAVGEFQIGRVSHEASVNFAFPVTDENGALKGAAFASLSLAYLNKLVESFRMPEGSSVGIVDRTGTLLARAPELPDAIGKNISNEDLIYAMLAAGHGSGAFTGLDGKERFYAYEPLGAGRDADAFVYVGLEKNTSLANLYEIAARNAVAVGALVLLTLAAAVLSLRLALKLKPF